MNHNDLRSTIQHYNWVEATDLIKALDGVVEMHSPVTEIAGTLKGLFCSHCDYYYPCPTIEAIEKELK